MQLHTEGGLCYKTTAGRFCEMTVRVNCYDIFQLGKCHDIDIIY